MEAISPSTCLLSSARGEVNLLGCRGYRGNTTNDAAEEDEANVNFAGGNPVAG